MTPVAVGAAIKGPPSPALEKTASVLESGDQVGSKSVLSPVVGILTSIAVAFPDVPRTCVCFDVVAAVDCTHATCVRSGERATSLYKTVLPNCSVSCCMVSAVNVMGKKQARRKCFML